MAGATFENAKLSFDLAIALPGGGLTALLLFPTGCTTDTLFNKDPLCLEGEPTNVFGWTMGGLVGNADSNGGILPWDPRRGHHFRRSRRVSDTRSAKQCLTPTLGAPDLVASPDDEAVASGLMRDQRAMRDSSSASTDAKSLQEEDGSDGTRTRDRRRDRPVRAEPAQSALASNNPSRAGVSCWIRPAVTGFDRLPPDTACAVGVSPTSWFTASGPPARSPGPGRRRRTRGPAAAAPGGRTAPALRCPGRTRRGRATACGRGRGSRSRARFSSVGVVRAVDDPQVLPAPALHGGLGEAPAAPRG